MEVVFRFNRNPFYSKASARIKRARMEKFCAEGQILRGPQCFLMAEFNFAILSLRLSVPDLRNRAKQHAGNERADALALRLIL